MACSCAPTDDGSHTVPATRGSGARVVSCPLSPSFPGGVASSAGESVPREATTETFCVALASRRGGCLSTLPPTPLARTLVWGRTPLTTTNHHPPTTLPPRIHACPLTAPDEPEVVAPLVEASLVVLIELALVEFPCVGVVGQCVGRGTD
eukprot:COSAG06_NODE_5693_length_3315_cov_330.218216_2_plen_150_part_00